MQLVAENLVLERGGRNVVDGLSLRLERGAALVLTGPNGSGKSTLLRALAGYLRPAAGSVRITGAGEDREASEVCHFVGHLDGIKTHLTAAENLSFWATYLGGQANVATRVEAALQAFALDALADIPAGYLSAGQKRRLALARLSAAERPLWLLDEPTVSLDAASVEVLVAADKRASQSRRHGGDRHARADGAGADAADPSRARCNGGGAAVSAFFALLKRDLRLAVRQGGALGTALGFYMLVVTLLPLGLGADLNLLSRIAPGVLWIALLLAALLSLGRVFSSDYEDGSLDILATGSMPMELVVTAKALAHWISTGIPLALMAPVLGLLLNLDIGAYPLLVATMLVGTPAVSFIGAVGAALTLRAYRGGLLIALLVLPLYVPTLIFGMAAINGLLGASGTGSAFLILTALSLISVVLCPLAAAAALRVQMQ